MHKKTEWVIWRRKERRMELGKEENQQNDRVLMSLAHPIIKLPFSLAQEPNLLALGNCTWGFSCPV